MVALTEYARAYHPIVHSLVLGTMLARLAGSMSMPFLALFLSREIGMVDLCQ